MSKHDGLIRLLSENDLEKGAAILMTSSIEQINFVGTVDTPDLLDFIETIFRMSPELKSLFDNASDRAEWPTS